MDPLPTESSLTQITPLIRVIPESAIICDSDNEGIVIVEAYRGKFLNPIYREMPLPRPTTRIARIFESV